MDPVFWIVGTLAIIGGLMLVRDVARRQEHNREAEETGERMLRLLKTELDNIPRPGGDK